MHEIVPTSEPSLPLAELHERVRDLLGRTASDLVEAFKRGRKPSTLRAYAGDLRHFRDWLVGVINLPVSTTEAQAADVLVGLGARDGNGLVLRFQNEQLEQGFAPKTVARRVAALAELVRLAKSIGLCDWSVSIDRVASVPYRDTQGPPGPVVAQVFALAEAKPTPMRERDTALLNLLWRCAFRRGEIAALRLRHYHAGRVELLGKGRLEGEWLDLSPGADAAIQAWLKVRPVEAQDALLCSLSANHYAQPLTDNGIYHIVCGYAAQADESKLRPHKLRHNALTQVAIRTNGDMLAVQTLGRHANMNTSRLYVDRALRGFKQVASLLDPSVPTKSPEPEPPPAETPPPTP